MEEKMKSLIELLDQLQDRTGILPSEDEPADEVLDQVLDLADELLITNNGQPNYSVFPILNRYGYRVFAGERDGFGWLTGCIQKGNGPTIVFG